VVRDAEEALARETADEDAPATETILLVEDEDQVRNLTRTMLQRTGYRVLEASGAEAAERLLAEHPEQIDLLLTDIVMPQTSGVELAERVRRARPGIKVVFMSGYTDEGVIRQGVLSAGVPYLQKPFTSATLRRLVREALQG
ncbi:MAG TPA: response regulator, partial [Candidatus Sulfopaludibacter sp.]|nr:response regulator [Candidatus Sulfopaludibacter sp.]